MRCKQALVVHSGGMDSSLCLKLAIDRHGADQVLSISFRYGQRHSNELVQAAKICRDWGVDHCVIQLDCLQEITDNALMNTEIAIEHSQGRPPNTLVLGRNGLMARLAAIHANHLGAEKIYMGVIEVEGANSGYRDCSRDYMDLMEKILRIDLDNPRFEIVTPIVQMTKCQTMALADQLGVLDYLLKETITCYEGIGGRGCQHCPACKLRNEGADRYKRLSIGYVLTKN
ncbi:7-cyano-7-deazaguanine synthase QueC [Waddlia chondrophila]|uniref:7-cyano-7-deazaguanine synthase n=1 Tax=Waddlia chondrophila (strain ATCC VR-1470 / WSU 86-1044) TaxID=716544 RepID=D6YRI5_WADCW|nr:7-cyano-7-deazaguanine synthase QueC [Waddlia chondrophila]ADI38680.1 Queuosine biosynthesis protein QueC [Waddlia chondrophila WSU 86-1044]